MNLLTSIKNISRIYRNYKNSADVKKLVETALNVMLKRLKNGERLEYQEFELIGEINEYLNSLYDSEIKNKKLLDEYGFITTLRSGKIFLSHKKFLSESIILSDKKIDKNILSKYYNKLKDLQSKNTKKVAYA